MVWAICGAVAVVLTLTFWVWRWTGRRRRVVEVSRVVATLIASVSARKRLLKALWHYHDTWRPNWFQSRSARNFAEDFKKTLKQFEFSLDDQNQGLGDIVEISIPDGLFSVRVSNTRLRRELRIVIDAVKKTLVLKVPDTPEPEPERHYREGKVN